MVIIHTAFPLVPGTVGESEQTFLYMLYSCIKQHAHKPQFGVQQLSESVQLSRAQLNRKLSQLTGYSALNLIMGYRFYTAKQLLRETDLPIKAIAPQCGFNRHSAFCRSFINTFGYSPSEFRETCRIDDSSKPLSWKIPLQEDDMAALQKLVFEQAWLYRLLKMVIAHISDELLTVQQLAAVAGLSAGTLSCKVKELFNVTPQRFVKDVRLQYACELLATGQYTIAETAYKAGFFDPAHFCRCFKAALGSTPSDYSYLSAVTPIHQLKEKLMIQNGK